MVQKYQSPVRVYKKPFELVMTAYEMRFPTCEEIPIVLDTEVIEEEVDEANGLHIIDRRAKLNIEAPYLLKKLMGVEFLLFRQRNTLDKKNRTLTIDAWNETFAHRIIINEVCEYSVHPENSDWTCFEQKAELDIKSFFGFEGTAEKLAVKEYSKSIGKSKDIMEHYIQVLAEEGTITMPIWNAPPETEETKKQRIKKESESNTNEDALEAVIDKSKLAASSSTDHRNLRRKSSNIRGDVEGLHIHDQNKEASGKLEQDYIQMYLGELSPIQESQLVQLKSWVSELLKGKVPSDPILLRFLRARDFNVEKAREMLSQSLIWRKKHGVDKILSEYELPPVVNDYFPGGWHMHDKEGRPLFILRLGQMDVKGLIKSVGEEGLTKLTLHVCEEGLRLTDEASHKLDRPISTWSLLLDLEGLNMRHLWRPGMKALLHIIEICEANYPETLGRVLIIRAPRVFPIMWTLVSPLIDETSRGKFLFYSGNDYQGPGGLVDYINPEHIPDWLGGSRETEIPEGGLVPKSYYMSVEEFEKDQSPGPHLLEDSIYNSTSLSKGQVHEGIIRITDKGSVITWDFDVMRHDVVFTVYRLKQSLKARSPSATPTPTPTTVGSTFNYPAKSIQESKSLVSTSTAATTKDLTSSVPSSSNSSSTATAIPCPAPAAAPASATAAQSTPVGDSKTANVVSNSTEPTANTPGINEHKSVIDKAWREGVDYFKVENSIVCHDGESIQGSHVTSHEGMYILQWKYYDKLAHTHLSPLDSLTAAATTHVHKSKVMYYYETLNSIDYKGSMTSLQSCQSGFSSISRHSTSGVSSTMSSSHSEKFPKCLLDNSDGKGKQLL